MPQDQTDDGGSLRGHTLRGIAFTASRGVFTALVRIGTIAVLARLLSPAAFGLFATALLLASLAGMILQRGLGDALVQRQALSRADAGTACTLLVVPSIVCAALFFAGAPWIERALALPDLAVILRVLSVSIPIEALVQLYRSDAMRRLEFERMAYVDALAAIVGNSLLPIALAFAGCGYWALVAGILAQALMQLIGLAPGHWRNYPPAFSIASVRRLFAFSALIGVWTIAGYCLQNIERLVLARVMGAEAVGYFSRARGFVGMFVEFYGMPVNQVLFPVLAKLQDERERLYKAYRHAIAFSALISLPSAVGVSALAAPLVAVMLGDQWGAAVPLVQIMGANVFFMVMAMPFVAVIRGIGELKETVLLTVGQTAALIVGAVLLYPYGLAAIAWCTVAIFGIGFVFSNRILAVKLRRPLLDFYRPMRAALIMAVIEALLWAGAAVAAPHALDQLSGAAVFVAASAAAFALLFFGCPRWFLGDDLGWLHEMVKGGARRLFARRTAGRCAMPSE